MIRKVLGVSLLLLAAPAFAGDLSYNYVDLSYRFFELDDDDFSGIDVDGDGPAISGSVEVADNWFITAGYTTVDFDFNVDYDQFGIGAGYHADMSENADVFVTLSYVSAEVSTDFGSVDEDGYGITVGLRGMVSDKVELSGALGYVDLGDAGDDTTLGVMAVYNFTENFGMGVGAQIGDDMTGYGIGARFYFGN